MAVRKLVLTVLALYWLGMGSHAEHGNQIKLWFVAFIFSAQQKARQITLSGFSAALSEPKVNYVPGDDLLFYALQGAHGEAPHDHHGWWKCRKCRSNFLPTIGDASLMGRSPNAVKGRMPESGALPCAAAMESGWDRVVSTLFSAHSKKPDRLLYRAF